MSGRWSHGDHIRTCVFCGRVLEPYESCDCMYPLPKDGLRAICPNFRARSSYRGRHYIVCSKKFRFESAAERDKYYAETCCSTRDECMLMLEAEADGQK